MLQDVLMKLGIPTYAYSVQTVLNNKPQVKIGDTLEVTVGWVYGLSVNVDGNLPDNSATLITNGQTANLYLTLKYGQSLYVNQLRLDHLVFSTFTAAGLNAENPNKYLPVNIPVGTDLKQSFYSNPVGISGPAIMLNLFYIDVNSYNLLLKEGIMRQNGQLMPKVVKQE